MNFKRVAMLSISVMLVAAAIGCALRGWTAMSICYLVFSYWYAVSAPDKTPPPTPSGK